MYTTLLLAGLAASAISASPLNRRDSASLSMSISSDATWATSSSSSTLAPTSVSSSSDAWSSSASTVSTAVIPNASVDPSFVVEVENAPTEVERYNLLTTEDPTHLKFDFNPDAANPQVKPGDGGQVDLANRANFPSLVGTGISAAVGFLKPCGLNTPHIHPRASEFLVLTKGENVKTGFFLENSFTHGQQNTTLSKFQGTVFPQGSIHFQFNDNCKPATFVSALSSEDPGASSIAQNFFVNLDPQIVDISLGFPAAIDGDNFAQLKNAIPQPFALDVQSCLKRCNIAH